MAEVEVARHRHGELVTVGPLCRGRAMSYLYSRSGPGIPKSDVAV